MSGPSRPDGDATVAQLLDATVALLLDGIVALPGIRPSVSGRRRAHPRAEGDTGRRCAVDNG